MIPFLALPVRRRSSDIILSFSFGEVRWIDYLDNLSWLSFVVLFNPISFVL